MSQTKLVSGNVAVITDQFQLPITLNTNIFASTGLSASQTPFGIIRIYAIFVGGGTLTAFRTKAGVTGAGEVIGTFGVNTPATFDIPVSDNETLNLQYSATTTATKFLVYEVINQELS